MIKFAFLVFCPCLEWDLKLKPKMKYNGSSIRFLKKNLGEIQNENFSGCWTKEIYIYIYIKKSYHAGNLTPFLIFFSSFNSSQER